MGVGSLGAAEGLKELVSVSSLVKWVEWWVWLRPTGCACLSCSEPPTPNLLGSSLSLCPCCEKTLPFHLEEPRGAQSKGPHHS